MQERKGGELKEHVQICQHVHIVEKHMIMIRLSASGKGTSQGRSKRETPVPNLWYFADCIIYSESKLKLEVSI